jgi:hypothetical protein
MGWRDTECRGTVCYFRDGSLEAGGDDIFFFSFCRNSKYGEEFATIYFLIFEYGESRERQCSVHNFNGLVDFTYVLCIRPFVREADGLSAMGLIIYIIFFI